jgi:hypothetical protein
MEVKRMGIPGIKWGVREKSDKEKEEKEEKKD